MTLQEVKDRVDGWITGAVESMAGQARQAGYSRNVLKSQSHQAARARYDLLVKVRRMLDEVKA